MSTYFITCPNCGSEEVNEFDFEEFECCDCEFEFSLKEAEVAKKN